MKYTFDSINNESLIKLYTEFGFRLKEIGLMVGISEDAVLKRIKQYGIPTNPRGKERVDVEVIFTGKRKDKKKNLTDDLLRNYCDQGMSDGAIAELYNMTGEGIAYRRKLIGINVTDKFNQTKQLVGKLIETDKDILSYDYYNLTQEKLSEKYGISKTLWRPILKQKGILSKTDYRIVKYPPITEEQNILIIGSLLGDGSCSTGDQFYEFHSYKQEKYLRKKYKILEPYSGRLSHSKDGSGLQFETVHHPNFRVYYDNFYDKSVSGKLIPVDFIKKYWHDHILAYWFFDDGHLDDEDNTVSIANFCPHLEQLTAMTDFLESIYHWNFKCARNRVSFSKQYLDQFVKILFQIITPDLYYKIPEQYITPKMVQDIGIETVKDIHPKFYRKLDDLSEKRRFEKILFEFFKSSDFPYCNYTDDRKNYLLQTFNKRDGYKLENDIILSTTSGLDLCEAFFPNIYESKRKGLKSPVELWQDDNFLQKLAVNRLMYADRLSMSSFRTGIKLLSYAVSNFKPVIAKFLYKTYAFNKKVLDYSCGFGSRMLAAMSLDIEYVGCEPNLKTLENLNKFGSFLGQHTQGKFFITDKGSEELTSYENYFSFAFSSPPFFDYEIYSQDPGQSIVKFPVYEEWLEKFWKKTICNCYRSLITGGYFGVCISLNKHEHIIQKTRDFCQELGLSLFAEYKAPYKQLFHDNIDKYDLISIYKK